MKTILLAIAAITSSMSMDAQVMKVYKGETLVKEYNVSEADRVVFEEIPETPAQDHEYVDLGLSVKWATCNIGAEKPEDYGLYFAWAETQGYKGDTSDGRLFNRASLKYCSGTTYNGPFTKYVASSSYGTVDNKTVLDPEDDAATANWGSNWRMPTKAEQDELRNNCTWTWTTQNGVNGYKVTATNGNHIFLPASGYRYDSYLDDVGSYGFYWSSSLYTSYSYNAYSLDFGSGNVDWYGNYRYFGQSVRAVCQ